MVDAGEDVHVSEGINQSMLTLVNEAQDRDGGTINSPAGNTGPIGGDIDIELHTGIEFESHEVAYRFYQEYAKSLGFTTSIKNSRRSKKSKDFIDAKFACSRYGVTPESDTGSSRRPGVRKTDCKASMHVKRNKEGKWVIHEFIKEHNHELLPALAYHFRIHRNVKLAEKNNIDILNAVSERTKKMYAEMSRQSVSIQTVQYLKNVTSWQFETGRRLVLEEGDAQMLLDYFMQIKKKSPGFFYAVDVNEEQQLRNLFWVDAKSRTDYASFSDVVSLDISYMRISDEMPLALFFGVNHHFQTMLLGCALLADETRSSFIWLMKTWLRAVNGKAPEVIITEQHSALGDAVQEIFPRSRHCFPLWNILNKVPENLGCVIKRHENFFRKFTKCIFKSWTEEQFEMRWWKMVSRFDLQEKEWVRLLYEDRRKWVPFYMADTFLAGMSTLHRSESNCSIFDKFIHKKMTLREFVRQYGLILQNMHEEEAVADFESWHKQPALKSPSPWEKQMSAVYTHTIFKKFQVEVLGVVGCHPRRESGDNTSSVYRVEDCEKNETFMVSWDETKSEVSCLCHSFEYRGFLCRHAMIVLQLCGVSSIPSHYILSRWAKDAKNNQLKVEGTDKTQIRVRRYTELCRMAIELSEIGSSSQESYDVAFRALGEILKKCVSVNNSNESAAELGGNAHASQGIEAGYQGSPAEKLNKKKNMVKRRKVPSESDALISETEDSLQQMDTLTPDGISLNGFYGSQQNAQGLVQLNLMEPPHDSYYVSEGLGQLHSIAPTHDDFFGAQQSVNGLGQLDFRQHTSFTYSLQDDHSLRTTQLHGDASRHA